MTPSEPPAIESVIASRVAAFERLKALHSQHAADLTREMVISDVRQLGFVEFWDSDADVLLANFHDFIEWYKPEQRQAVKFLSAIAKQKHDRAAREQAEAQRAAADELFFARMREMMVVHAQTLLRKRRQMVFKNDYGVEKGRDRWVKEVQGFVTDLLPVPRHQVAQEAAPFWASLIDRFLDDLDASHTLAVDPVPAMSGADFEVHCAEILASVGWQVVRKGGSGDQGVDLIASKSGLRLAIQCKRYAGSVGNKAVQEVFAGMSYECCHRAAVVSNAPFTASAVKLASSTRVLLIDEQSLPEIDEWLALP